MIGQQIPAFDLLAYPANERVNEQAIAGRGAIVHFLHAAFSSVCATELQQLSQLRDVNIVSVCPDSMYAIIAWVEIELSRMVEDIPFPILSDSSHELRNACGISPDERAVFFVDSALIVHAEIRQPAAVGIGVAEVARIHAALEFVYDKNGGCTPADWIPGRPGIPPGATAIGQTWKSVPSWPTVGRDSL